MINELKGLKKQRHLKYILKDSRKGRKYSITL